MNKIERVASALEGKAVDRPPFSFWYHFGLQHMPGRKHAEAEIDFYRAYDLDFLKVMNDYPFPLPDGLEAIETQDDWKRIEPIEASDPCWSEQLTALSIINEEIGREAMFIETIFSPWTTARRLARADRFAEARERHPQSLLAAMEAISTSLAGYASQAVARGAAGIFISLGAATNAVMSAEEYAIWGRPFDLKILEAVRAATFNVLHIHGKQIHFESLLDYPVSAINWSHFTTQPTLADGRSRWGKTILGGIDETSAAHLSPEELKNQISNALVEAGPRGLIVAPGCSVPTDTSERNLRAIVSAVKDASV